MEMTFRWYGKEYDKIKLADIRQIPGMKGIVGTLFDLPAGAVWPKERIKALVEEVESSWTFPQGDRKCQYS